MSINVLLVSQILMTPPNEPPLPNIAKKPLPNFKKPPTNSSF